MATLTINVDNVQPLDTILTGLSGLSYSGNAGLYIKVNATEDGFEFAAASGGGGTWGSITGTLSDQADLQSALDAKLSISTAASTYLTISNAASTYATIASLSSYLTTAAAASTYLPLTGGSLTGALSISQSGATTALDITQSGSGTSLNINNSGSGNYIVVDTNKLVLSNAGNLSLAGNLTIDTNVFFVDATNNWVRIGDTGSTNGDLLEIIKNQNAVTGFGVSNTTSGTAARARFAVQSNGNRGCFFNVWSDGYTTSGIGIAGTTSIAVDSTNGFNLATLSASGLGLWTNTTRRMTITSGGLVAIGNGITSSYPALKRSTTALQIRLADDSGYAPLEAATVSINTSVANYKLNIYDAANGARMGFYNASTGTTTADGMFIGLDDGLSGSWWNFEAGYIRYGTSNTERMRITSGGQIVVGTTSPAASALFQIDSTTLGFLPPRMTTAQKTAISSPTAGLVVYDTTLNKLCVYTTSWETITSS